MDSEGSREANSDPVGNVDGYPTYLSESTKYLGDTSKHINRLIQEGK